MFEIDSSFHSVNSLSNTALSFNHKQFISPYNVNKSEFESILNTYEECEPPTTDYVVIDDFLPYACNRLGKHTNEIMEFGNLCLENMGIPYT